MVIATALQARDLTPDAGDRARDDRATSAATNPQEDSILRGHVLKALARWRTVTIDEL